MKSLVTGGAGFIGSQVARCLLEAGHEVTVLDDLSGGYVANVPEGATFIEGSLVNAALVDSLMEVESFDYVFHLAAYAAEGMSHFIRRFNYENNLIGSINLVSAAVRCRVKCFVYTSSFAVYGHLDDAGLEDAPPNPIDPYGVAKLAVEYDLRAAHEVFGMDYVVFRPHNVYGPFQNIADPYRNVIGIYFNRATRDEPLTIFGDGTQTRSFSYIDDIAPVIARSIDIPAARCKIFNVGGRERHSINDVAAAVSEALGKPLRVVNLPERHEAKHTWANHDRLDSVFGVRPTVPLEDGIARMAEWVSRVGPREPSKLHMDIDITRNMPPSWLARISKQEQPDAVE